MTVRGLLASPDAPGLPEPPEPPRPPEPREPSGARARRIAGAFGVTILVLAVVLLVIVALLPRVSGWHFVIVAGGSMEPTIPFGSVAVMRSVDAPRAGEPTFFAPGEIIEYRSPETGQVTTHRIVSIVDDTHGTLETLDSGTLDSGTLAFQTQGDANNAPDRTPVPVENVLGRYQFHVPWVGDALIALRSPAGYLTLVLVPGSALLFLEGRALWSAWKSSRSASAARR